MLVGVNFTKGDKQPGEKCEEVPEGVSKNPTTTTMRLRTEKAM